MNTICIFGASISYGAWDREKDGWPNRLRNYFESQGQEIWLYNLSIGGNTSEHLLSRLKNEAKARTAESPIDLIIFSVGINDSRYLNSEDNPRVSLDKFKKNLKALLEQSKEFTEKIIFIGLTKVDELKTAPTIWSKKEYFTNDNISKYNEAIESFCEENKVFFIKMIDLLDKDDLDKKDGLHPNSKGHEKMFFKIKDFLLRNQLLDLRN